MQLSLIENRLVNTVYRKFLQIGKLQQSNMKTVKDSNRQFRNEKLLMAINTAKMCDCKDIGQTGIKAVTEDCFLIQRMPHIKKD